MKKQFILALMALGAVGYSCNNETSNLSSGNDNVKDGLVADLVENGGDRVDDSTSGEYVTNESGSNKIKHAEEGSSSFVPPLTVPFKYVSSIRSGINAGETQQANAIVCNKGILKDYFYIAYGTKDSSNDGDLDSEGNSETSSFNGYIDVLKLVPSTDSPYLSVKVVTTYHFENIDLFGLTLDDTGSTLYATGAANMDEWNKVHKLNPISSNAVFLAIDTDKLNSGSSKLSYKLVDMPGHVAKNAACKGDKLAVISGDDGYAVIYNTTDFSVLTSESITDGRSVGINDNGSLYYLTGDNVTKYLGASQPVDMDESENPGAQRLIGFHQGKYPLIPLGKNGVQVFSEDLSSTISTIPIVKNNSNFNSIDEQANQATSLSDSLIAIAEGSNGVMIHHMPKKPATDGFPCKGGIYLDGSPNDICTTNINLIGPATEGEIDAKLLFVANGEEGTTVMMYAHDNYGIPTYELEWDPTSENQVIPGNDMPSDAETIFDYFTNHYVGIIYAPNLNYETPANKCVEIDALTNVNIFTAKENSVTYAELGFTAKHLELESKSYFNSDWSGNLGSVNVGSGASLFMGYESVVDEDLVIDGGAVSAVGEINGALVAKNADSFEASPSTGLGYSVAKIYVSSSVNVKSASNIGENYEIEFMHSIATFGNNLTLGDNVVIDVFDRRESKLVINGSLKLEGKLIVRVNDDQDFKIIANGIDGYTGDNIEVVQNPEGSPSGTANTWENIFEDTSVD
ncbi:MAG: hypothetical protein ACK5MI_04565 [Mangrovibacterium sp.]